MLHLPDPRGPVTERLVAELRRPPHVVARLDVPEPADPLADDDMHLGLYLLYELHYRGLPGVEDRWEWEPSLLRLCRRLEERFEAGLVELLGPPDGTVPPDEMDLALRAIVDADERPSLSTHLQRDGTLPQFLEFVVHRSAYQLKEADPHSWALPRLSGPPKAAMVEIQADEYGGGKAGRVHAQLFADTMEALGLDSRYGAYVDAIPGFTLATVNLVSLFGLHRRWRGAVVGHLALFEMTSSVPNRRYADGLRGLGISDQRALEFYDEHVVADAVHENVAAVDLAGGLVRQEPAMARDVVWGARALTELEGRFAERLLAAWAVGESSLRTQVAETRMAAEAPAT